MSARIGFLSCVCPAHFPLTIEGLFQDDPAGLLEARRAAVRAMCEYLVRVTLPGASGREMRAIGAMVARTVGVAATEDG